MTSTSITQAINQLMGKLIFVKSDIKDHYVVYAASILSSYANDKKCYFLAFVPIHIAIPEKAYLYELPWVNFQARILDPIYKLRQQRWEPPEINDVRFRLTTRQPGYSSYIPETGEDVTLLLLHDTKRKSIYQYYEKTTLMKALDTFNCVINYEGKDLYSPGLEIIEQVPM